ncbi:MAG: endonuclease III [Bacteroidia bacterium]|nr:endonuclease III [Bacteroidia bacterium]
MTTNKVKIRLFKQFLDQRFPDARCELNYQKDYQLVIAVVLSAQTTDAAVNKVTPVLFSHFDSLDKLSQAPLEQIENDIHAIGLFHNKAKNIKAIATMLINDFGGVVPSSSKDLLSLPGVGNKTRNVIQAELFRIPAIAVDTHVMRVSTRLGFAKTNDTPDEIEQKLKKLLVPEDYIKTNHQIIIFGRNICHARNPQCEKCAMRDVCLFAKNQKYKESTISK